MELKLRFVFLLTAILTFVYILNSIRKNHLSIDDSIVWILWSLLLVVFGLFPNLVWILNDIVGFISPANFIICLFIFFSYAIIFFQSIKISQLKEKNNKLIQQFALLEKEIRDKFK